MNFCMHELFMRREDLKLVCIALVAQYVRRNDRGQ